MTRIFLLCVFLFVAPVCASEVKTVLIVSIDALHPAALSEKTSPTLDRLMRSGRFTLLGRSVTPPQTLIAHAAMMTGLTPEQGGRQDNDWKPGQSQVAQETLFDLVKQRGFRTAYFYAKPKLGYLVSAAVDEHALARDDGMDRARAFLGQSGKRFVFLHISGLEDEGADTGWLSEDYLDELTYIDMMLAPLLDEVAKRGRYLVLVTSDHAGHERQHGTLHPEDFRLPLIMDSSQTLPPFPPGVFNITELKQLLQKTLEAIER
jgi:arylsulfatase A-like enzyme